MLRAIVLASCLTACTGTAPPQGSGAVDAPAGGHVLGVVGQQRAAELEQRGDALVGDAVVDAGMLAAGVDEAKSAEAARLSSKIAELWAEARAEKARRRFGSPELIQARARAEERLERDTQRKAA